jgi:2-polyprenyl-6-hydroxyphenyl methylase/3-demethylubiquinone-9 3-methyltransferase
MGRAYVSSLVGCEPVKTSMLVTFIGSQQWLSRKLDELLPADYRVDGNRDFLDSLVPKYLRQNMNIVDVGGGRTPYLTRKQKASLNAKVVGLDIDSQELSSAPDGTYDEVVCADITKYYGGQTADLVICQALLEHVQDVEKAFVAISSILRPGGRVLVFVPSRNAIFARLNLLLPQRTKRWLLHTIFPATRTHQGFVSYYDQCTPSAFKRLAKEQKLSLDEERYYYISSYFSFFFPFYLTWRLWIVLFRCIRREQAAETFSMVLRKEDFQAERTSHDQ